MELLVLMAVAFLLAIPLLALLAFARATGNQGRIEKLESEVTKLRVAVNALRQRLDARAAAAPEAQPATEPIATPEIGEIELEIAMEPPAAARSPEATPLAEEPAGVEMPLHEPPSFEPQLTSAYEVRTPAEASSGTAPEAAEPPPPPPPPRPSLGDRFRDFDWESLIGVKLFSWIAGIALALAALFFLKYSFERGLLAPPVRMAIGMITGIGILVLCELRVAQRYRVTANALDAAGVAILYATLFSSYAIWHLLPGAVTFPMMILVTVVAVALSIRRDSVFIALLGLIGGFATPAMLSSGEDHPITLFSYLLMLNGGLAWVAYRKRWPVLAVLALLFTTLYQWGWVVKFLGTSNLPLAVSIFLAFPLLSVGAFFFGSRDFSDSGRKSAFGRSAAIASIVPVTFAIYLAAVPAYGERHHLLFTFLLLVDLGLGVIASTRRAPEALHAVGAISTVLVVAIWIGISYSSAAWPSILVWATVLAALYLATPLWRSSLRRSGPGATEPSEPADRPFRFFPLEGVGLHAVWAAPLLLFVFPVLAAIEPATRLPWALFGTQMVLLVAIAFVAARSGSPGPYHLAAILAIVTEVVWSAKHLGPETLHAALIVYGTFAMLFIAVPVWSARDERSIRIEGSPHLLGSFLLLFFLAGGVVADIALTGLALLLVILLAGLYLQRSNVVLISIALFLSWLVLQTWWSAATLVTSLVPALIVLAGLSLLILAGGLWLKMTGESAGTANLHLALVGHLFLMFVASRPELALPPWPLFAILGLLLLAIAAVSHLLREGSFFLADMIATQIVLVVWAATARSGPWPATAVLATATVAGFGLVWLHLSGRSADWSDGGRLRLSSATLAGLFLGQVVTIVATQRDTPWFVLLLLVHVALLGGVLYVTMRTGRHGAAVAAVLPVSVAIFLYRDGYEPDHWLAEMILGSSLYLMFVAYPILIGRRAGKRIAPYLAPILMSVSFFFFAREGLIMRGFGDVIGLLPIAQAAILALLVYHLVRLEPAGERTIGRLALVAGVALGFVTVAIPLQLEREWITIGWALEGAALVWLFRRVPHRGLLYWATALFVIVFVRLAFNPAVLAYHPRSDTPIFNWYFYTYAVSAGAFFAGSRLLPEDLSPMTDRLRALWVSAGTVLLFLLLNIEIADYFSKGPTITFNFSAGLAQDLTYTLGWALFAIALLIAGLLARNRAARMAAIGLLLASVFKGFLRDLMKLGGLYRIASLVGLAIALAFVAVLLQKYVLSARAIETKEAS